MKLVEATNEDALDLIAELIEPFGKIASDAKVQEAIKAKKPKLIIAKEAIKANKEAIIEILAICKGVPVNEYKNSAIGMLKELMDILNNEEIASLFS